MTAGRWSHYELIISLVPLPTVIPPVPRPVRNQRDDNAGRSDRVASSLWFCCGTAISLVLPSDSPGSSSASGPGSLETSTPPTCAQRKPHSPRRLGPICRRAVYICSMVPQPKTPQSGACSVVDNSETLQCPQRRAAPTSHDSRARTLKWQSVFDARETSTLPTGCNQTRLAVTGRRG